MAATPTYSLAGRLVAAVAAVVLVTGVAVIVGVERTPTPPTPISPTSGTTNHSGTNATTSTKLPSANIGPGASTVNRFAGLPPSHDNDVGHSRIIDQYPDADVDWYQRPH